MIAVASAPPFATIQDLGRFGYLDSGVPVSGVADRDSALLLNAVLGNDPDAALIEWAVAGGSLVLERDATIAFGGAEAALTVDGIVARPLTAIQVPRGGELRVERIISGRFLLIAVRGGIDVPLVLGSRSTLLSAALGGFEGRRLRSGDRLPIGPSDAAQTLPDIAVTGAARSRQPIRVMRGPQADLFDDAAWSAFLGGAFTVSRASDRTGYRLEGTSMHHSASSALPSEPACVGAIQVPGGGAPIVLMHDGPTVGGYPKIAVVRSADMSRFAQLAPGDSVTFALDVE